MLTAVKNKQEMLVKLEVLGKVYEVNIENDYVLISECADCESVEIPLFILNNLVKGKLNKFNKIETDINIFYIKFSDCGRKFYISHFNKIGYWYPTELAVKIMDIYNI